jgi:hypothetical protein
LNGGAFFHAEFGIRHRSTLPEVGVLHSVFAAAGRFHYKNLFYGGTYQNNKFGRKYIAGGILISHKDLKKQWLVNKAAPANEVLLKIEASWEI